jgi:hypothetical protein
LVNYLFEKFKVDEPKLIISVIGSNKNFEIETKIKLAFQEGIAKIAKNINPLIITMGINAGVSKLTGEAIVQSSFDLSKTTLLGITPWGIINDKDILEVKFNNKEIFINNLQF